MFNRKSTTTIDMPTLRAAIEQGDEASLVALYADDATLTIVDHDRPPSKPTVLTGTPAIAEYYHDVCGRAMTHNVEQAIVGDDGIAFTEACRYPDGMSVLSSNLLEVRNGKIARHTLVQAWDA
jgi:ketosteroid isomerase-like protein